MILPSESGGWVALGISLALWGFIFYAVILAWREGMKQEEEPKRRK